VQYFCFFISGQEIGINIEDVIETTSLDSFTVLPNAPKHILGLVNHRGNILPVISLLRFFDLSGNDSLSNVVYLKKDSQMLGLTASKLSKTIKYDEDIIPFPKNIDDKIRDYYLGIIKYKNRTIQVLNTEKLIESIKI
jgi:purine-binding chemotaxis protein CheW